MVVVGSPLVAVAAACGGSDLVLPRDSEPSALTLVHGDNQTAAVGTRLPDSLVVRVTNTAGRPVAQLRVAFALGTGAAGGTVAPDSATTDADGKAVARWTLGPTAGPQTVEARVVGADALRAVFTATAQPGGPAGLTRVRGDGQSATAGAPLPDSLVVRATDAKGNAVVGLAVTWAAIGGGAVSPASTTTGADGRAATQRTLGPTAGPQTTMASASGVPGSPLEFASTAVPGPPAALAIATQPSSTVVPGTEFARQPQVQLRDALGNAVRQAGLAVQAAVASGSGVTLTGQRTASTDPGGMASFTDLGLTGTPGIVTLSFSAAQLQSAVSDPIALTGGVPSGTRSTLVASPLSITLGGTSAVTVTVRDANGIALPNVTVLPATNGAGAFTPTSATTGGDGVATFSFASSKAGTEKISARAGAVALAQTATITVTRVPSSVTINDDTPDPSVAGQPYTVSFSVTAPGMLPTGTVTVSDGRVSCTAAAPSGACQLASPRAGTLTVTASYAGDAQVAPASGTAPHTVLVIPTAATLSAAPNPAATNESVTFTAVITGASAAPAGSVQLVEGSILGVTCGVDRVLATKSVTPGGAATSQAAFKRSFTLGVHYLRACFEDPAGAFGASASNVITQVVQLRK
ncbi:MAG TPA: Ig-like domain-containing protein [Gemmatimonadales bacterium]|nr:Ig-like domain-containing protein [Gemmatimonadales bacterium]